MRIGAWGSLGFEAVHTSYASTNLDGPQAIGPQYREPTLYLCLYRATWSVDGVREDGFGSRGYSQNVPKGWITQLGRWSAATRIAPEHPRNMRNGLQHTPKTPD